MSQTQSIQYHDLPLKYHQICHELYGEYAEIEKKILLRKLKKRV